MTSRIPASIPSSQLVFEGVDRRQLLGEIEQLKQRFGESSLSDDIADDLRNWLKGFEECARLNPDGKKVREIFVEQLRELLKGYYNRDQMSSTDSLSSHEIVQCAVTWLRSASNRGLETQYEERDEGFAKLVDELVQRRVNAFRERSGEGKEAEEKKDGPSLDRSRVSLSVRSQNRLARIRLLEARVEQDRIRNEETASLMGRQMAAIEQRALQSIDARFNGLNQRIQQVEQRGLEQVERDSENHAREQARGASLVDQLQIEIRDLRKEIQELNQQLNDTGRVLSETKQADLALQRAIAKAKEARKNRDLKCAIGAAVTIALAANGIHVMFDGNGLWAAAAF